MRVCAGIDDLPGAELIVNSDDTWDTFWLCDMHNISLVWES